MFSQAFKPLLEIVFLVTFLAWFLGQKANFYHILVMQYILMDQILNPGFVVSKSRLSLYFIINPKVFC